MAYLPRWQENEERVLAPARFVRPDPPLLGGGRFSLPPIHRADCPPPRLPPLTPLSSQISAMFTCNPSPPNEISLAGFIAHTMNRTQLPAEMLTAAVVLLHRLHTWNPDHHGSSGHRLFLAALMVAHKFLCDDPFSNKSWTIVGRVLAGLSLRQVNMIEQELLGYLGWEIIVSRNDIRVIEVSPSSASLRRMHLFPWREAWGVFSSRRRQRSGRGSFRSRGLDPSRPVFDHSRSEADSLPPLPSFSPASSFVFPTPQRELHNKYSYHYLASPPLTPIATTPLDLSPLPALDLPLPTSSSPTYLAAPPLTHSSSSSSSSSTSSASSAFSVSLPSSPITPPTPLSPQHGYAAANVAVDDDRARHPFSPSPTTKADEPAPAIDALIEKFMVAHASGAFSGRRPRRERQNAV